MSRVTTFFWKPFILLTARLPSTCRSLALDNLHDIAEFASANADPHRGSEWYILYFGFQASLALLISLVSEPRHPSASIWRDSIQRTVMLFRQLGSMHEASASLPLWYTVSVGAERQSSWPPLMLK